MQESAFEGRVAKFTGFGVICLKTHSFSPHIGIAAKLKSFNNFARFEKDK
jgi:hypothetical protein